VDTNLRSVSGLTAWAIDEFMDQAGIPLPHLGVALMAAERAYGVNARYLLAHMILETGWGKSYLAQAKRNLFGFNAYDRDPIRFATTFPDYATGIDYVARFIAQQYLSPTGIWWAGAPTLRAMNVHYASGLHWAESIAAIAAAIPVPSLSARGLGFVFSLDNSTTAAGFAGSPAPTANPLAGLFDGPGFSSSSVPPLSAPGPTSAPLPAPSAASSPTPDSSVSPTPDLSVSPTPEIGSGSSSDSADGLTAATIPAALDPNTATVGTTISMSVHFSGGNLPAGVRFGARWLPVALAEADPAAAPDPRGDTFFVLVPESGRTNTDTTLQIAVPTRSGRYQLEVEPLDTDGATLPDQASLDRFSAAFRVRPLEAITYALTSSPGGLAVSLTNLGSQPIPAMAALPALGPGDSPARTAISPDSGSPSQVAVWAADAGAIPILLGRVPLVADIPAGASTVLALPASLLTGLAGLAPAIVMVQFEAAPGLPSFASSPPGIFEVERTGGLPGLSLPLTGTPVVTAAAPLTPISSPTPAPTPGSISPPIPAPTPGSIDSTVPAPTSTPVFMPDQGLEPTLILAPSSIPTPSPAPTPVPAPTPLVSSLHLDLLIALTPPAAAAVPDLSFTVRSLTVDEAARVAGHVPLPGTGATTGTIPVAGEATVQPASETSSPTTAAPSPSILPLAATGSSGSAFRLIDRIETATPEPDTDIIASTGTPTLTVVTDDRGGAIVTVNGDGGNSAEPAASSVVELSGFPLDQSLGAPFRIDVPVASGLPTGSSVSVPLSLPLRPTARASWLLVARLVPTDPSVPSASESLGALAWLRGPSATFDPTAEIDPPTAPPKPPTIAWTPPPVPPEATGSTSGGSTTAGSSPTKTCTTVDGFCVTYAWNAVGPTAFAGALTLTAYHPIAGLTALPAKPRFPVIVTIPDQPGTGNVAMANLAGWLAARGAVVFTADTSGGDWRTSLGEVACAVSAARSLAAGYGGNPGQVALLAYGQGGISAAALTFWDQGNYPAAANCHFASGPTRPDLYIPLGAVSTATEANSLWFREIFMNGEPGSLVDPAALLAAGGGTGTYMQAIGSGADEVLGEAGLQTLTDEVRAGGGSSSFNGLSGISHAGLLNSPAVVNAIFAALN
jgi:hypothetical protein